MFSVRVERVFKHSVVNRSHSWNSKEGGRERERGKEGARNNEEIKLRKNGRSLTIIPHYLSPP